MTQYLWLVLSVLLLFLNKCVFSHDRDDYISHSFLLLSLKSATPDPGAVVLYGAEAVFRSWNNERAVKYRQINKVTGLRGTAVNIQAMAGLSIHTTTTRP